MAQSLRVLLIEDTEDDALLLERELGKGEFDAQFTRVETAQELEAALESGPWNAVLSDYNLPGFNGLDALRVVRAKVQDIPFILVSGVIGEEQAVEAMKAGVHDFILKGRYARLVPALERELHEADIRRERRQALEKLHRAHDELEVRVRQRTAELVTANLELAATNEELAATNEELEAADEELRAQREELDQLWGETRLAEEARLVSELRYRDLFASLQECFALHEIVVGKSGKGVDFRFLEVNPAFGRFFGVERDSLVGRTLGELSPGMKEFWMESLVEVALTGRPVTLESYSRELERYFEVHAYMPASGQIASLSSDVTEKRRFQAEQEKSARLESLGLLAGGIAHDFNNILTAIIGNISLARVQVGEGHRVAARLAECEKALSRATELTGQLLTFSRGGEPVKGVVDAERLLREVVSFSLHGSRCKAQITTAEELWRLNADSGQIHQVFSNLIINSCQAMPGGGLVTICAVNETVSGTAAVPPGRYVKISVTDQGCGIAPEDLPRIFDPYFTTKPSGTGLGLASVFSIVRRHGGAVSVSSVRGAGTTFEIILPATDAVAGEAEESPGELTPASEARVLVMDDEEMIRSLAAEMLRQLGYGAVTCGDGREAVDLYRACRERGEPFAAVILDMTVPAGMGGKEAAARILAVDPDAVLVISSGYSGDHVFSGKKDPLFRGIVAKPYNLQQLARELSQVIENKSI